MRTIEFRAWDKIHKGWFEKGSTLSNLVTDDSWDMFNPDDYVWEQYTGLKDKNGKEIFEGDIVKYGCGLTNVGKVVFDGKFGYSIEYRISNAHVIRQRQESFADVQSQVEVVGNIHQNADLLEAEND